MAPLCQTGDRDERRFGMRAIVGGAGEIELRLNIDLDALVLRFALV